MPNSEKSVGLFLTMIALVVNVFVIGLLTYTLLEAKHHQERQVRTTIENLALLLDHSVTESVGKIDLSLRELADELQRELRLRGRIDTGEVNDILANRRSWIAGLADIRVTDAFGAVAYGPGAVPGSSFTYADRQFFSAHRSRSDSGLIVTNPILGRVSKSWVISFSRRYNLADGSFAGVISAAVPVSHFEQLLSDLDLGPNGIAVLRDADTAQIARHPAVANPNQQLGTKAFSKELADIIASGVNARTYHSEKTGDGVERTNTYRRLSAVPFHLVVGMAATDYLADWRDSIWKGTVFAAFFLVISTLTAYLLWRSFNLTRKASKRSKLLLQHASDGIHILDSEGNIIEVSDSFCRMLGYARAEVIGMNVTQFYTKFPPDMLAQEITSAAPRRPMVTLEARHRCKDGSIMDVEITTYPLELDGRPVLYASSRDITERRKAEYAREQLTKQLELLSERLAMAQENERRKIAYELHEELGQELTTLNLYLQIPVPASGGDGVDAPAKDALAIAAQATERIRRLVLDLFPSELEDFGLYAAARAYCQRQAVAGNWNLHLNAPKPDVRPPQALERACFRVLQESLDSVVRRAKATDVWVDISQGADKLELRVRCNGSGFDWDEVRSSDGLDGGGLGFFGMQIRAKQVGGAVEINSWDGAGIEVRAMFPLPVQTPCSDLNDACPEDRV